MREYREIGFWGTKEAVEGEAGHRGGACDLKLILNLVLTEG
jgi:hypothetical protein